MRGEDASPRTAIAPPSPRLTGARAFGAVGSGLGHRADLVRLDDRGPWRDTTGAVVRSLDANSPSKLLYFLQSSGAMATAPEALEQIRPFLGLDTDDTLYPSPERSPELDCLTTPASSVGCFALDGAPSDACSNVGTLPRYCCEGQSDTSCRPTYYIAAGGSGDGLSYLTPASIALAQALLSEVTTYPHGLTDPYLMGMVISSQTKGKSAE